MNTCIVDFSETHYQDATQDAQEAPGGDATQDVTDTPAEALAVA